MSKNKNYVQGRAFEYKVVTIFRRKGYFVVRSAGSHGVADLVAHKKGKVPLFIQCKAGSGGISREEQNELFQTASESDAIAVVATKENRKPTVFKHILGFSVIRGDAEQVVKESNF